MALKSLSEIKKGKTGSSAPQSAGGLKSVSEIRFDKQSKSLQDNYQQMVDDEKNYIDQGLPVASAQHASENQQYGELMKQAAQSNPKSSGEKGAFAKIGDFFHRFSASTQVAASPDTPMFKSKDWSNKSFLDLIKSFGSEPEYDTSVPTPKQRAIEQRDQYDAGNVGNNIADFGGEIASFFTPSGGGRGMSAQGAASAVTSRLLATKLGQKAEEKLGNLGASVANKANPLLNAKGINVSTNLASKAVQKAGEGAVDFGIANTLHKMQTSDAKGSDLAWAAGEGILGGAALGAALPVAGAGLEQLASKFSGTKLGNALKGLLGGNKVEPISSQEVLALPSGRGELRLNAAKERANLAPNESPISSPGRISNPEPLGLPQGNYNRPQRLRVLGSEDSFNAVIPKIFTEATQRMTPPLENPNVLAKWVQRHLNDAGHDVSLNEVRGLNYEDLRQVAEEIRTRLVPADVARKTAYEMGYGKIFDQNTPKVSERVAQDAQKRSYGIYPDSSINIEQPKSFNKSKPDVALGPLQRVGFKNTVEEAAQGTRSNNGGRLQRLSDIRKTQQEELPTAGQNESVLRSQASDQLGDIMRDTDPRIRDKVYNYLDEAEKAARERLKAKKNTLSSLPVDQYADHAIILAAKIGKGGIRLADATEILVKEFGEEIRPHAKAIYNRARSIVQDTERRATKEAKEAREFNENQTGDASTFRSKVSRDVKSKRTSFKQKWEKIRSQVSDDLAALEGLEKRIRGKLSSAEESIYKAARMFRGVPEKANQIVRDRLAPIINDIEKKGYTSADLGDYALAVHARDVNVRDIKSGFTNKEIDEVISQLQSPELEAARRKLVKIGNDMLEELAGAGVISRDLVTTLRERYPNYVPLFRAFDDEAVNFADGLTKAMANVTAPIKALKGSERQVIDPLENMVKNIFQSVNAAERNKVAMQLSRLAKNDSNSVYIRELKSSEDVGRKNVVSVLVDGEKVRFEVEPEVYKALLSLDSESSNMLIKILQKPAALLRAGATLTPEFSLRNPMRDITQAFITSNSGFNPLIDFPVGLIQSISKGDLYKQWANELGAYGNIISGDRKVHRESLEKVLKQSPGKKFVNIVTGKSLIRLLRVISDTTESATKVGEFRAALRQGQTPQEAAYRSRDIMDFGRSGSSIRETNKVVAFLNANIQGKSKLIRAFKENPGGFTARAFTAVTVPTIGVFLAQKYLANEEQKRIINESPAWLKDTFWLMPIPGTDMVARIPKPFDISILFSNLPERALNYVYNNDKESFDGFARKAMADMALPGMISGLTPIIEGMANYSFFQGGRIIPQGEDGREFSDQFNVNTTETAKGFAKVSDILTGGEGPFKNFSSPRIMDNTIKGLTAGLGGYATSAIDSLLEGKFFGMPLGYSLLSKPERPAKGPAQLPLAKAFLVNPTQSGKSTEQLYDLQDKLTRAKGSATLNGKSFIEGGRLDLAKKQTGVMGDITKAIRSIENDVSLPAKKKREQIDQLLRERNDIAVQSMQILKQMK